MEAAGDLIDGIYMLGSVNGILAPLDGLEGEQLEYATTYQEKGAEYGMSTDDIFKGFAAQGFSAIMNIWEASQDVEGDVTGKAISDAIGATDGSQPSFGGPPLNCAGSTGAVHRRLQLRGRHRSMGCRDRHAGQRRPVAQRARPGGRHRTPPRRLIGQAAQLP